MYTSFLKFKNYDVQQKDIVDDYNIKLVKLTCPLLKPGWQYMATYAMVEERCVNYIIYDGQNRFM